VDNAKKIVEVEMKQKGTPLHDARCRRHSRRSLQGQILGRTQPVIKFTTLFGLLAVELCRPLTASQAPTDAHPSRRLLPISFTFVYRSFYSMRIRGSAAH